MLTTSVQWVALYAAINILIALILALLVVRQRLKSGILIGTGGNAELERASRAHANNIEYVPLALAGLVVLSMAGASIYIIHGVGLTLTVGRILHGFFGLGRSSGNSFGRSSGVLLTWIAIAIIVLALAAYALGF